MKTLMRALLLVLLIPAVVRAQTEQQEMDEITLLDQLRDAGDTYSLFLEALEQEGQLIDRLADPDAALTVFPPDDRAFSGTMEAADLTVEALMDDPETLREVLAHHVVPAAYSTDTLRDNPLTYVMTALDERGLLIQTASEGLFVNGITVMPAQSPAANGYLHPVSQLLIPPQPLHQPDEAPEVPDSTLAEQMEAADDSGYGAFAELLEQGEPALLERLRQPGPYTVFAPSDSALETYLDSNGLTREALLDDEDRLNRLLAHHILPGRVSGGTVTALIPQLREDDDFLLLALDGSSVQLDVTAEDAIVADDGITMTEADQYARNGVLHRIDGVLVPDAPEPDGQQT